MFKTLALLASCAACSSASGDREETATPTTRSYATQTNAPSPDYRDLLNRPMLVAEGGRERGVIAPLPPDANAIGDIWIARLEKRHAMLGYGLAGKGPDGPVQYVQTGLTEDEFVSWANENGWRIPDHIRWTFASPFSLPRVSDAAKNAVRFWPASTSRTGPQKQALLYGRVELRNGCFFVGSDDGPADKLAWFHAEIGLDKDASGYFILRDRVGGQTLARLGEDMNWGGPPTADIGAEAESALHDACGPGDIVVVGSPESRERMLTQYPHLREPRVPPPPPPPRSKR